jgi:hypothetical protein
MSWSSGTLIEHPQSTKCLLERHRLDVIELLDAGHHRIQLIRGGVEELLHHGGVVEGHAKPGVPRSHATDFAGVVIKQLCVLHD